MWLEKLQTLVRLYDLAFMQGFNYWRQYLSKRMKQIFSQKLQELESNKLNVKKYPEAANLLNKFKSANMEKHFIEEQKAINMLESKWGNLYQDLVEMEQNPSQQIQYLLEVKSGLVGINSIVQGIERFKQLAQQSAHPVVQTKFNFQIFQFEMIWNPIYKYFQEQKQEVLNQYKEFLKTADLFTNIKDRQQYQEKVKQIVMYFGQRQFTKILNDPKFINECYPIYWENYLKSAQDFQKAGKYEISWVIALIKKGIYDMERALNKTKEENIQNNLKHRIQQGKVILNKIKQDVISINKNKQIPSFLTSIQLFEFFSKMKVPELELFIYKNKTNNYQKIEEIILKMESDDNISKEDIKKLKIKIYNAIFNNKFGYMMIDKPMRWENLLNDVKFRKDKEQYFHLTKLEIVQIYNSIVKVKRIINEKGIPEDLKANLIQRVEKGIQIFIPFMFDEMKDTNFKSFHKLFNQVDKIEKYCAQLQNEIDSLVKFNLNQLKILSQTSIENSISKRPQTQLQKKIRTFVILHNKLKKLENSNLIGHEDFKDKINNFFIKNNSKIDEINKNIQLLKLEEKVLYYLNKDTNWEQKLTEISIKKIIPNNRDKIAIGKGIKYMKNLQQQVQEIYPSLATILTEKINKIYQTLKYVEHVAR